MKNQLTKWALRYRDGIPGDVCPLKTQVYLETIKYPTNYGGSTVSDVLLQTTKLVKSQINKTQSPSHIITQSNLVEDALDTDQDPMTSQPCQLGIPYTIDLDGSFASAHTVLKFTDWKFLLGVDKLILQTEPLQYVDPSKIDNVLDYLKGNYQTERQLTSRELHSFIQGFGDNEIGSDDYIVLRNSQIIRPAHNRVIRVSKIISDMVMGMTAEEVLVQYINNLDGLLLWANRPEFDMMCDIYSYEQDNAESMFPHVYIRVCGLHFDRSHDEDDLRDLIQDRNKQIIKKLLVEIL